jgi:thiosulfate/3-mercaptopyruvate sulfurtransferase
VAEGSLDLLVSPEWLEARLEEPDLRIVDASWYLPAAGRDAGAEYAAGHLPGAVFLDISTDLSDPDSSLKNTVASPASLARAFGAVGIGSAHRVIVYDRLGGYSAGRVWWLLRYAGHRRVALLDGGLPRWEKEGRPLTREVPRWPPARFEADPQPRWLRSRQDVERILQDGSAVILDARSEARFRGEADEPAAPRKGHIPGARNLPHALNLTGEPPVFRPREELRALYAQAGIDLDRPVVVTCGSGVTAALDAFALTLLGHADVAVYDGSWNEWGSDPALPIEP